MMGAAYFCTWHFTSACGPVCKALLVALTESACHWACNVVFQHKAQQWERSLHVLLRMYELAGQVGVAATAACQYCLQQQPTLPAFLLHSESPTNCWWLQAGPRWQPAGTAATAAWCGRTSASTPSSPPATPVCNPGPATCLTFPASLTCPTGGCCMCSRLPPQPGR